MASTDDDDDDVEDAIDPSPAAYSSDENESQQPSPISTHTLFRGMEAS